MEEIIGYASTALPTGPKPFGAGVALWAGLLALVPAAAASQSSAPALPADLDGQAIFRAACAGCHGPDGTGQDAALVGFDQPLPDFTDCDFASREPQADWVGMAHEGGARNGFSTIMPAFGDALSEDQLERVVAYVASLCTDPTWPRGELNLPRPLFTEKAYPEDEAVLTTSADLESGGPVDGQLVYERRFGHQSQIEVVVPFGWRVREDGAAGRDTGAGSGRVMGLGDLVVGLKRTLLHDPRAGSILSVGGEVKLPTGDADNGFGGGGKAVEAFLAFGQILPGNGFLHVQTGAEAPTDGFEVEEVFARLALGKTLVQDGGWGRAWSPMVEMIAVHDAEEGETIFDVVPQLQVSINRRQHILASAGVSVPVNEHTTRPPRLVVYLLWDWFDGGFFDGW